MPTAQHVIDKSGDSWCVTGVQQFRVLGHGGWRVAKKTVYLQKDDGAWRETMYLFQSKELAEAALVKVGNEIRQVSSLFSSLKKPLSSVVVNSSLSRNGRRW